MTELSALQRELAEAVRAVIREELRALRDEGPPPSPFMTVAEAAEVYRCTERTIRRKAAEGKIESVRRGGRLLIPREPGR